MSKSDIMFFVFISYVLIFLLFMITNKHHKKYARKKQIEVRAVTKLCIDCKWCVEAPYRIYGFQRCICPHQGTSPVSGKLGVSYCDLQRQSIINGPSCGPKGNWFEPKESNNDASKSSG